MTEFTEIIPIETPSTEISTTVNQPYWHIATSDNTRKAYQSDVRHFIETGGLLPASTESILHYLNQCAEKMNPRTLKRRLVAIKQWHLYQNFPDPTAHPLVKKTLRGIARVHGIPAEKAQVLTVEQLKIISSHLKAESTLANMRDLALLLMGFFGAFRRSELVAIKWQHVKFVSEGMEILIPRSKTDPEGEGSICAIPYGSSLLCPVMALKNWQSHTNLTEGFIFRAVRKNQYDLKKGLSAGTVNRIIKQRLLECGFTDVTDYSGHSLRRGFATAASQKGASLGAIMRQGRWRHEATVHGYIEEGKKFEANAAAEIFSDV